MKINTCFLYFSSTEEKNGFFKISVQFHAYSKKHKGTESMFTKGSRIQVLTCYMYVKFLNLFNRFIQPATYGEGHHVKQS